MSLRRYLYTYPREKELKTKPRCLFGLQALNINTVCSRMYVCMYMDALKPTPIFSVMLLFRSLLSQRTGQSEVSEKA